MTRTSAPVVVITGASSGIGLATARHLAAAGARLALLARTSEPLEQAAAQARSAGAADVLAVPGDVGSPDHVARLADATAERFGRVDGLYLNAAMAPFAPLDAVTAELAAECLAVNVTSPLLAVQRFLPQLGQGSSVLLTGSALHHRPVAEASVWAASSYAVSGLAAALAVELAPRGVRVNTISHGPVDTPVYGTYGMPPEAVEAMRASLASGTLAGRLGHPDEVAELAATLLTGAGFVTGTEIVADGGWARAGAPG